MAPKFAIWVNGKDNAHSGYLTEDGKLAGWPTFSLRFNTAEEANQALLNKGLIPDTSARVGMLTAYICEV